VTEQSEPVALPRQPQSATVSADGPLRPRVTPGAVHALSLLVGFVVLLVVNRHQWFTGDDWEFITNRGVFHARRGLLEPHNEHWSTVPILLFRFVLTVFGTRSYLPFLLPVLVAHLVVAHLLWRLLLRMQIAPWLATALAGSFVVIGAGAENLLWAFQVGFVASVTFGLAAVYELATGGVGPPTRRRLARVWIWTVLGLASSGVGLTWLVVVGLFALMSFGARAAAQVVVVPALVYAAWFVPFGRAAAARDTNRVSATTLPAVPEYVWTGLTHALSSWVGIATSGGALALALLIVGLRLASEPRQNALPLAMAVGSVVFFLIGAYGRLGLGPDEAAVPRYAYIAIALLLPLAARALSLVTPSAGVIVPVVSAVILTSTGLDQLVTRARDEADTEQRNRVKIVAAEHLIQNGDRLVDQFIEPTRNPDLSARALASLMSHGNRFTGTYAAQGLLQERLQTEVTVASRGAGLPPLTTAGPPPAAGSCPLSHAGSDGTVVMFASGPGGGEADVAVRGVVFASFADATGRATTHKTLSFTATDHVLVVTAPDAKVTLLLSQDASNDCARTGAP
jgi:hypothetical protein